MFIEMVPLSFAIFNINTYSRASFDGSSYLIETFQSIFIKNQLNLVFIMWAVTGSNL